jgi:hypothetical protein
MEQPNGEYLLQERRKHQAELARQKNEETARRLASGGLGSGDGQGPNKTSGEMIAYRNVDDIPARELKIHVSGSGWSVGFGRVGEGLKRWGTLDVCRRNLTCGACVCDAGGPEERGSVAADLRFAGAVPHSDGEERVESAGWRALVHQDHLQRAGSGVRAERHTDAEVRSVDIREGSVVQVERYTALVPGGAADKDAASAGCATGVGACGEGDSGDAGEAADREG